MGNFFGGTGAHYLDAKRGLLWLSPLILINWAHRPDGGGFCAASAQILKKEGILKTNKKVCVQSCCVKSRFAGQLGRVSQRELFLHKISEKQVGGYVAVWGYHVQLISEQTRGCRARPRKGTECGQCEMPWKGWTTPTMLWQIFARLHRQPTWNYFSVVGEGEGGRQKRTGQAVCQGASVCCFCFSFVVVGLVHCVICMGCLHKGGIWQSALRKRASFARVMWGAMGRFTKNSRSCLTVCLGAVLCVCVVCLGWRVEKSRTKKLCVCILSRCFRF